MSTTEVHPTVEGQDGKDIPSTPTPRTSVEVLPTKEDNPPASPIPKSETPTINESSSNHLSGIALIFTLIALCAAVFCVALDITIISTAIPRISDEFGSLQDIGWYGSAYLLTTCALQLPFGKLYGLYSPKWVFLISLLFFEVGSALCGAAPSSVALIIGRAIAGVGGAGLFCGAMVIIAHTVPLEKRPMYQSLFGGMFGIASVVGPLIGGAFTDHVTWRWCFYINLPIGAVTTVIIVFYLHLHVTTAKKGKGLDLFLSLDPLGLVLFMSAIICILLALQWGGTKYAWDSGRIIALFVVFAVLLVAFIILQARIGENATVPPRIGLQRTVWSSSLFIFCAFGAFNLLVYFLPIYFQAIHGLSPSASGVASIPLILSNVIAIITTGVLITKFGHYVPYIYFTIVISCIACGLITTFETNTSTAKWVGYQLLYGFGIGASLQIPLIATQNVLPVEDIPTGMAIVILAQNFGPAVMISAANNILNQKLVEYISAIGIKDLDPAIILRVGATGIRSVVPVDYLGQVLEAYNEALRQTFYLALGLSFASIIGGVFIEWTKMKESEPKKEKVQESEP